MINYKTQFKMLKFTRGFSSTFIRKDTPHNGESKISTGAHHDTSLFERFKKKIFPQTKLEENQKSSKTISIMKEWLVTLGITKPLELFNKLKSASDYGKVPNAQTNIITMLYLFNELKDVPLSDPIVKNKLILVMKQILQLSKYSFSDFSKFSAIIFELENADYSLKDKSNKAILSNVLNHQISDVLFLKYLKAINVFLLSILSDNLDSIQVSRTKVQDAIDDIVRDKKTILEKYQKDHKIDPKVMTKVEVAKVRGIIREKQLAIENVKSLLQDVRQGVYDSATSVKKLQSTDAKLLLASLLSIVNVVKCIKLDLNLLDEDVVLRLIGSIVGSPEGSVLSIPELEEILPEFRALCQELFRTNEFKSSIKGSSLLDNIELFHITANAGPNGSNALLRVKDDAYALLNDPALLERIDKFLNHFGIVDFKDIINSYASEHVKSVCKEHDEDPKTKFWERTTHSKCIFFPDKGGKERVVSEVDWFTQTSLNIIERCLKDGVKKLKGKFENISFAYDQDSAFNFARNISEKTSFNGCLDFQACTDNLPVNLQQIVVEELAKALGLDPEIGKLWRDILVEREFSVSHLNRKIRFKTGQPMGAKSSWLVMHITVAILCNIAELRALKNEEVVEKSTCNIGDDTYFGLEPVFNIFVLICNAIKLPLAQHKTIINRKVERGPKYFEFLKRHYYNGDVLLPISSNKIKNFLKSPEDNVFQLIRDFENSGLPIDFRNLFNYIINTINSSNDDAAIKQEKILKFCKQMVSFMYLTENYRCLNYTKEFIVNALGEWSVEYLNFLDSVNENPNCKALYLLDTARNIIKRLEDTNTNLFLSILGLKYNYVIVNKIRSTLNKLKTVTPNDNLISQLKQVLLTETGVITPLQAIVIWSLSHEYQLMKSELEIFDNISSETRIAVAQNCVNEADLNIIEEEIIRLKNLKIHSAEEIFGELETDNNLEVNGIKPKLIKMLEDSVQHNTSDVLYRKRMGKALSLFDF